MPDSEPGAKRASLIALLVEEGCFADKIDSILSQQGYAPLTEEEKVTNKLALPDDVTAADLLGVSVPEAAAEAPSQFDQKLTVNPVTGQSFTVLNAYVVQLCAQVSHLLRAVDLPSWEKYRAMKAADPSVSGKTQAYQWAWDRLLKLGYQPTAKGQG